MDSEATITDRDSLSASSPHHARTRRSAPLYNRRLASLLIAFAFVLSYALPSSAATITVSDTCTLPDAITAANTDTATGGCTAGSGRDTIRLSGTINLDADLPTITAPVDIRGPSGGYATIDGQGTYSIFTINDGVNPRLERLILQNAFSSSSGAAIHITGGGTISNLQFLDNTVSGSSCTLSSGLGAGLSHAPGSGSLDISSSRFIGNSARCAGAMWSTGSGVGRDLIFRDNVAVDGAGALDTNNHTGGNEHWTLSRVTFDGNMGGTIGGALDVGGIGSTSMTLNNATFTNNSADRGGAIRLASQGDLVVNGATFDGNTASSFGSALYNTGDSASLNHVRLRNNSGGIAMIYAVGIANITSINCILERRNNSPDVISDSVTITNNNCSGNGGSQSEPAPERDSGTVNQVTIAHNEAVIDEHGYGVTTLYGLQTISLQGL